MTVPRKKLEDEVERKKPKVKPKNAVSEEMVSKIRADIERWRPGLWAEIADQGPACKCGLSAENLVANAAMIEQARPILTCPRHPEGRP